MLTNQKGQDVDAFLLILHDSMYAVCSHNTDVTVTYPEFQGSQEKLSTIDGGRLVYVNSTPYRSKAYAFRFGSSGSSHSTSTNMSFSL